MENWTKDIYIKKLDEQIIRLGEINSKLACFMQEVNCSNNIKVSADTDIVFCVNAVAALSRWFVNLKTDINNGLVGNRFLQIISGQSKRVDELHYKLKGINNADEFFNRGFELTFSYFQFFDRCSRYHDVFKQIGYFEKNCVVGGAHGSGKTSFCLMLKKNLGNGNCLYLNAYRLLQVRGKYFDPTALDYSDSEKKVFEENIINNGPLSLEDFENGGVVEMPSALTSTLDDFWRMSGKVSRLCAIFNEVFAPNRIYFSSQNRPYILKGVKIKDYPEEEKHTKSALSWPLENGGLSQMVAVYLICQMLLAPKRGFIIVDRPELLLNCTCAEKLWNLLERERKDCIFVYVSDSPEFAASRISYNKFIITHFCSKKAVKSLSDNDLNAVDRYKIIKITNGNVSEDLQFRLLSSGKKLLFVHQPSTSLPIKILIENVLRRDFVIQPLPSAENVIFYTQFFNSCKNYPKNAFGIILNGLIDDSYAQKIKQNKVFVSQYYGWEAMLLEKKFLIHFAEYLGVELPDISECIVKMVSNNEKIIIDSITAAKMVYLYETSVRQINSTAFGSQPINYVDLPNKNNITKTSTNVKKNINMFIKQNDVSELKNYIIGINSLEIIAKSFGLTVDEYVSKAVVFFNYYSGAKKLLRNFLPPIL